MLCVPLAPHDQPRPRRRVRLPEEESCCCRCLDGVFRMPYIFAEVYMAFLLFGAEHLVWFCTALSIWSLYLFYYEFTISWKDCVQ